MAPPPPPPPDVPSSQQVLQFLTTALSQRGPSALPYAEDTKFLIRQHLLSLLESFPSLHPETSSFTHNDGRTLLLLRAHGTIPILFSNILYHLPASLWLPDRYPFSPPSVFLTPTPQMLIKSHHPHVDRSGFVLVPYLRNWLYPSSNLLDLVRSLSHLFSLDPPLFSRPSPNPNPNPSSIPAPYDRKPAAEDAADVFRRNAINKIVDAVHNDIARMNGSREAEIEGMFAAQSELRRREKELGDGLREMVEEKEGLERQLQTVLMNADLVEEWIRGNEGKEGKEVDLDEVFLAGDLLSRQLVDCTAADLAVEDCVYSLDKGMQEGAIEVEVYLKSVRGLSREQFFHRALEMKVRAAQVQAQVEGMAARAGSAHYAS